MCSGLDQFLTFSFHFVLFYSPINRGGGGGHGPLVPPLAMPVLSAIHSLWTEITLHVYTVYSYNNSGSVSFYTAKLKKNLSAF